MKAKLKRFAIFSVLMITSMFLILMLLDMLGGTAGENVKVNLIIAVSTGILTPASLIFCKKSRKNPLE